MNFWAWGSYLNTDHGNQHSNGDGQLSLDITKSFNGRLALSSEVSLMAANDHFRGQLEEAYASALLSEDTQTVFTAGKFHANIGVEPRDFWDRLTGTTSLLFSAEPQDLVGLMLTQPLASTHISLKPFLATDFQGHARFRSGPAGGVILQYRPAPELTISLTNWLGPGYAPAGWGNGALSNSGWATPDGNGYGGYGSYGGGAYGGAYGSDLSAIDNWLGPNFHGNPGGLLYFLDGNILWHPRPDLTLAAEALSATTRATESPAGWQGCLLLASFNLTDQWRAFGRWSLLNDPSGIVTGMAQRRNELSTGLAWQLSSHLELRGEYRHDFSNVLGNTDTLSLHMSLGF